MDFSGIITTATAFLPNLIIGLVIILVTWIASKIAYRTIMKIGETGSLGRRNVYYLLASAAKMATMAIGVLMSLGTIGIDVTPLVAGVGLSGLALGLALKDAVTNLLNGILILVYEPFKEGDIVKVSSSTGRVGEINLRYIQLINEETGKEYLIPNSLAFSKEIEKNLKKDDKSEE